MMLTVIVFSIICLFAHTEASCRKSSPEMFSQSVTFLNCIGDDLMSDFLRNFDRSKSPRRFVDEEIRKTSKAFENYNCIDPTNYAKDFENGLRVFGVPSGVVALVPDFREIIWTVSKSPDVSECILEDIRAQFLKYVRDCTGLNIPTAKGITYSEMIKNKLFLPSTFSTRSAPAGTLKGFPVASRNTDLGELQRFTEFTILTFMSLAHCGRDNSGEAADLLQELVQDDLRSICSCVKDSYDCDCKSEFLDNCRTTKKCLDQLTEDALDVFDDKALLTRSKYCVENFESDRNAVKTLVQAGTRLGSKIRGLDSNNEMDAFGDLVKGTFQAMFQSDFCTDCGQSVQGSCRKR